MSIKVLSTKKLTTLQKQVLLDSEIHIQEYEAIQIQMLAPVSKKVANAIVTSQNSAKALITSKVQIEQVFCVGKKTANLLQVAGYRVEEIAPNAVALAHKIILNHSSKAFVFFCGNRRRPELPALLAKHNIDFREEVVYHTELNPIAFTEHFNAVIFFSPSAVQSFAQKNEIGSTQAFAIGETTAKELKRINVNSIVAKEPAVEATLAEVVLYFNKSRKKDC